MAVNGSGIRDTARVLKISTSTVIKELKKRDTNKASKFTFIKTTTAQPRKTRGLRHECGAGV